MTLSDAVRQLREKGFKISLNEGKVKVSYPGESPPEEAKPLIKEIKDRKKEVVAYLSNQNKGVDEKVMLSLFSQVTEELDRIYSPGAFRWLEENRPDMDQEITRTERELNEVWLKAREGEATLEEFKKALKAYSQAIKDGIKCYAEVRE